MNSELIQQATNIGVMINVKKTREMLIGRALKVSIPPVVLNNEPIQRFDTFKFRGRPIHISSDLKWGQHMIVILSKAAFRLYFLKQLKRAGAGTGDLLCFLADRTNGRAIATVLRPSSSVCRRL